MSSTSYGEKKELRPSYLIERMFLGSLIGLNSLIHRSIKMKVTSDLFFDLYHKEVYDIIINLHDKGVLEIGVIEIAPFLAERKKMSRVEVYSYLNEIADSDSAIRFEFIVEQLFFYHRERERAFLFNQGVDLLRVDCRSDEEQRQNLEKVVSKLTELQIPFQVETESDRVKKARDRIVRAIENRRLPVKEYSWNVEGVDESGILPISSSELTIIGARPSTGKSSLLRQMAESLFMKNNEDDGIRIIFTREVKEHDWLYQMASSLSKVPLGKIQWWKDSEKENWLKWYDFIGKSVENKRLIIRHDMKNVEDVVKYTKSVARHEGRISFFGMDYLQQYTSNQGKTRDESTGITTSMLKELAMDLDIPVVVPSQLNREVDRDKNTRGGERPPSLSDLRESGNIEQDADKVVFLWRPSKDSVGGDNHAKETPYEVMMVKKKDRNKLQFGENRLTFVPSLRRFEKHRPVYTENVDDARRRKDLF